MNLLSNIHERLAAEGSQTLPYGSSHINRLVVLVVTFWFVGGLFTSAQAQGDCGIVNSINFPVPRDQFKVMQDFGAPSVRYQGRYHTGEDFFGGRGTSYGQPVSAIADGRVTYSAPNGWGRDGGVLIIQHTFPDGSIYYSMYGHMMSTDAQPFPQKFACVRAGDVVGTIGDIRPAPHVHLEIRTNNPDTPGAGYSIDPPTEIGDLQPTKFILNWQTWLNPAHKWHLQLPNDQRLIAPPLVLNDGSMLVLTNDRIRLSSIDGRVLWRIILPQPAVALSAYQGNPLVIYTDGSVQIINLDASLGEYWLTGTKLEGAPVVVDDLLVFHTPDNALVAIGADRHSVAWRLENVPAFQQAIVSPNTIWLLTEEDSLITISPQGQLLNTLPLAAARYMTLAPNSALWVYTQIGVVEVDNTGKQTRIIDNLKDENASSAFTISTDGTRFSIGGSESPILSATDLVGNSLWQVPIPDVAGHTELIVEDKVLLLLTTQGDIVAIQSSTGLICNRLRIYGDRRSTLWSDMGSDGVLRVGLADQIIGLDWKAFVGSCGSEN